MSLLARPRAARFTIPILLAALWTVAPGNGESNREWTTSSFMDFVDGALTDGGANTYVGADGTVRLINLWDLNDDGQLDLLFPSSHDHNEKVDLFIYWGRSGLDPAGRTRLPSNGGKAVAIADLNQDRQPDLIVVNRFNGTRSDLDSFIYWGSRGGFEPGRRTLLPTRGAEAVAVADLNGDGWKEVVFANSGLSYHVPVDRFNRSFIYWGAASGYSPDRRTSLKTVLARDVEIADLDRDGALDLVFASEGNEDEESGAWIYWGDGSGDFSGRPPTRLPGQRSAAVAATDLNGDGWPEVVLANRFRLRAREMGIYNIIDTVAVDSYVYWGSREGYAVGRRSELPTVSARDVEAADLNGDGRPDLVFANGAGGASYIYWAAADGFHPHKRVGPSHLGSCRRGSGGHQSRRLSGPGLCPAGGPPNRGWRLPDLLGQRPGIQPRPQADPSHLGSDRNRYRRPGLRRQDGPGLRQQVGRQPPGAVSPLLGRSQRPIQPGSTVGARQRRRRCLRGGRR